jgi:hypothetical protein
MELPAELGVHVWPAGSAGAQPVVGTPTSVCENSNQSGPGPITAAAPTPSETEPPRPLGSPASEAATAPSSAPLSARTIPTARPPTREITRKVNPIWISLLCKGLFHRWYHSPPPLVFLVGSRITRHDLDVTMSGSLGSFNIRAGTKSRSRDEVVYPSPAALSTRSRLAGSCPTRWASISCIMSTMAALTGVSTPASLPFPTT